ncbi:1-acyl-sn-glycerol-3-phosphate acyltransferase [Candidatus Woesearchaeota archaeon]|nr:1-acyl-sn-glycerol-3-phosphate acyltransferase [Candidatus Woesearchaeota archaeon]
MNTLIKKPLAYVIYYFLWLLNKLVIALVFRPSIKGKENIPRNGPFIFVCNHEDNSDALFLTYLTYRRLYFLAHGGLFRPPARSRFFMHLFDQIQTVKEQSTMVVNKSADFLRQGKIVVIFPEGTIDGGREIIRGHTGAARIAILSGVQVVPVAINNSYGIWPKRRRMFVKIAKAKVNIGKPMIFHEYKGKHENRKVTRKVTNLIMEEIKRLYKEA